MRREAKGVGRCTALLDKVMINYFIIVLPVGQDLAFSVAFEDGLTGFCKNSGVFPKKGKMSSTTWGVQMPTYKI